MGVAVVILSPIAKPGQCRLTLIVLSGLHSHPLSLSEMFATTSGAAGLCAGDESIRERIGWLFVIPRTFRRTTTGITWSTARHEQLLGWNALCCRHDGLM